MLIVVKILLSNIYFIVKISFETYQNHAFKMLRCFFQLASFICGLASEVIIMKMKSRMNCYSFY